jgi:RND family efflux transporter MFP subunit
MLIRLRTAASLLTSFGLAFLASAHEGHDHSGASLVEDAPQAIGAPIHLAKPTQFLMEVRTDAVREETLPRRLRTLGRIVIPPSRQAKIHAPVTGLIEVDGDIPLPNPGDTVDEGQVVARLVQTVGAPERVSLAAEIAATRTEIGLAQEEVDHTSAEYERVQALGEAVSERRVVEARAALKKAKLREEGLQEKLKELLASKTPDEANPGIIPLRAPISGTVAMSAMTVGEFVDPSRTLMEVVSPDVVWAVADIYEHQLPFVDEFGSASVKPDGQDTEYAATINHVSPRLDEATRTANVVFEVPNPGHKLREGMFVDVHIDTAEPVTGVMVPKAAVFDQRGVNVVYVKTAAESFVAREITVRDTWPDHYMIEEGVLPGEVVVVQGIYQVRAASMQSNALPTKEEQILEHGHEH